MLQQQMINNKLNGNSNGGFLKNVFSQLLVGMAYQSGNDVVYAQNFAMEATNYEEYSNRRTEKCLERKLSLVTGR